MLLEPVPIPTGVDLLSRVFGEDAPYVPPLALRDRHLLEPCLQAAAQFGVEPEDLLVRAPGTRTSVELSVAALGRRAARAKDRWVVLAQSEPDRDVILPPLARVHEEAGLADAEHFGLTHLGANAAVDAVALLGRLLSPGEQALLVLNDQRLLARPTAGRARPRDAAVLLRVCHGAGQLSLLASGRATWPAEAFDDSDRFHLRLADDLERIRRDGCLRGDDVVLAQNLFGQHADAVPPEADGEVDLGAADVWHRLATLLERGRMAPGSRALLAATGGLGRVSYALVEVAAHAERCAP